jgi:hypothetical protein
VITLASDPDNVTETVDILTADEATSLRDGSLILSTAGETVARV